MAVTTFNCGYIINRCVSNMRTNSVRYFSLKTVKKTFMNYFRPEAPMPPYNHICQLGDPVLRMKATPVDAKVLQTNEFQKILEHLARVMRKYQMPGLSAPQIGLPLQIFVIEVTEKMLNNIDKEMQQFCEMDQIPLTYFINPKMVIKNPEEFAFHELCGSVVGFTGEVLRAKEVEIKALNRLGTPFSWSGKGWAARIVQHEIDHLNGKIFIDRMDLSTFKCSIWDEINKNKGYVQLKFYVK
ncbi:peptide deformylase, mitochondrial-like [Colletes gigas]|uniref:peptide deformylase, mitochondrial-like n=1 Tax=Colletes gigas TaxID=935657 RepID=UPI001C9B9CD6|nr:peptide deformylase, mitochondrial-like [Colletes gigas]